MNNIILITGKKGAGKDTVAKMIRDHLPNTSIQHFAYRIKETLATLLGMPVTEIEERKNERINFNGSIVSIRHALQTLGTEWGRDTIHSDLWVNVLVEKLKVMNHMANVVIPDTRFPNEVGIMQSYCNERGIQLTVVRVERDTDDDDNSTHESETHELPADHIIVNNGTMEDTADQVELAIDAIEYEEPEVLTDEQAAKIKKFIGV